MKVRYRQVLLIGAVLLAMSLVSILMECRERPPLPTAIIRSFAISPILSSLV